MTFKKWLITLMVLLMAADIAILLDIPVLRQILGFSCFFTIPGLLILYILKLNEIGFLKKFVLSVGLSLSFLIFAGLLINTLLPRFGWSTEPLATPSLVLFFSLAIVILCFSAYWRNRAVAQFTLLPKLGEDFKNKHLSLLLLPLLFPFLAIIGRQSMNAGGSNAILMVMYILIPLYIVLVMWQNRNIPKITYPLAIGMISLALLLARGLMSNYLVGGDIYSEYHSFQVVSRNLHWSIEAERSNISASLSVSLLPAMFQSILRINPLYVFKAAFPILISLLPVIGYAIYEKYLGHIYSFLSSFFYMAQTGFIITLLPANNMRIGISMLSFSLALLVLFDDHITGLNKRILFLIFMCSLIVEYYVLPVAILGLLFILWLVTRIFKGSFGTQFVPVTITVLIPAMLIFLWWGQLTATAFNSYLIAAREIFTNLSGLFVEELYGHGVTILYRLTPYPSLLMQVPGMIQRISLFVVSIGIASILMRKERRVKFSSYAILMAASIGLVLAWMLLPKASLTHAAGRLYLEFLIIMAPAFVVGCQEIPKSLATVWAYSVRLVKSIKRDYYPKYTPPRLASLTIVVIGVILISQYLSSSGLCHLFIGMSGSDNLDRESAGYLLNYRYDSEVAAAKWLAENNAENIPVYMSNVIHGATGELFEYTDYALGREFRTHGFSQQLPEKNSYTFLAHISVVDGLVNGPDLPYGEIHEIEQYAYFYTDRSKIYASGGAEIYR